MDYLFSGRLSGDQYAYHKNQAFNSIKNNPNKAIQVNLNLIKGFCRRFAFKK